VCVCVPEAAALTQQDAAARLLARTDGLHLVLGHISLCFLSKYQMMGVVCRQRGGLVCLG
jgi:hypothetical protein